MEKFVAENKIFLNQKINLEREKKGLIIIEAYFGLDEHIYKIDAGAKFKLP